MSHPTTKRKYTCSECAKTFKNIEDMHMHSEVCVMDALEMESHAVQTNQPFHSSIPGHVPGRVLNDYQAILRPFGERDRDKRRALGLGDLEHEDDDDDFDVPPQLELAEPLNKRYKRIFPVGEDGKQIRPRMECPTCGLVLYRHNFSTHFRIHTGEMPFTCLFCEKRFRTSSALTVHTRCHTGDKPYMCPHCEYSCITKRNLDRHIVNNHIKRRRVQIDRRTGLPIMRATRKTRVTHIDIERARGGLSAAPLSEVDEEMENDDDDDLPVAKRRRRDDCDTISDDDDDCVRESIGYSNNDQYEDDDVNDDDATYNEYDNRSRKMPVRISDDDISLDGDELTL